MARSIVALFCAAPASSPAVSPRSAHCRSRACARPRQVLRRPPARKSPSARTSARIARSAARWWRKLRTAYGSARSPAGIRRSTAARIAPRAPRCASSCKAIDEIGAKLTAIREKSGPDSVYWLGSAKFSNEGSYLYRKFAAFWGTNNVDHQARICHSTTVAGVANTWGYGAMTNSYNDIRNAKTLMIMGGNPAEAHPVSLQHLLEGKELNRANFISVDPRLTRTSAHATEYVRVRPGTHIPTIYGMLWHIFQNGWEDKEFIKQRVYGMDEVRKEIDKWTPDEVERVTGLPEAQVKRVAEMFAKQKPSTLIWAMGQTQFTVGTANVRASCILLLATGNVGNFRNGANIFRGHCNVQGATDLGLDIVTLPLYYGLVEGAWKHWCRVWETDYDWMLSRFDSKQVMEASGIPSTRWFDAAMLPQDQVKQKDNLKAMIVF